MGAQLTVVDAAELASELVAAVRDLIDTRDAAPPPPELVTVSELARLWSCSPGHIRKCVRDGMPVVRIGASVRYSPADTMVWLRGRQA